MARLIDAEKLKAHYAWWKDGTREMTMAEAKDIIDEIVDLQPTVEKHGQWYDEPNYLGTCRTMFFCSRCGSASNREDPYCWHCGAKMEVEDDADE